MLRANPPDRLLPDGFGATDPHRLGHAGIDVRRLNQCHHARFEPGGLMRRQVLEVDARLLELAHERGVPHERGDQDDLGLIVCVQQAANQASAQHVAGGCAVRH